MRTSGADHAVFLATQEDSREVEISEKFIFCLSRRVRFESWDETMTDKHVVYSLHGTIGQNHEECSDPIGLDGLMKMKVGKLCAGTPCLYDAPVKLPWPALFAHIHPVRLEWCSRRLACSSLLRQTWSCDSRGNI